MLDVAECITTMIEAGLWTRTSFPTKEELASRFAAGRSAISGAFTVLETRGVLVLQADPSTKNRLQRLLPPPTNGELVAGKSHERLLAVITERVTNGTWTVDNFPTIMEMCVEFECGTNSVSRALRTAEKQGIVHRSSVAGSSNKKAGQFRYQPGGKARDKAENLAGRITTDIRSGELTGPLPVEQSMCLRYRVIPPTLHEAYDILKANGHIRRVWLPDFSRRVWHIINSRTPTGLVSGEGTKTQAVAADLARRLPEWFRTRADGQPVRRRLPSPESLRKHYHTSWQVVVDALNLLVGLGLLERVDARGKKIADYLPLKLLPKTNGGFMNPRPRS